MGLSVGLGSQGDLVLSSDTLSAWVSALATVCIAILTIFLAKETWALRQVQLSQIEQIRKDSIKPNVDIYLKSSHAGFNFMDVYIINNGFGVAQNIKFNFANKNSQAEDVFQELNKKYEKLSMLANGISSLGAGDKRSSFIFSFIELHASFGDRALEYQSEVDIRYQDNEGKDYVSRAYFNFSEYKGITELGDGDPLRKISRILEKIQKDIGHFSSGFKKLKADIYTSDDREREREEWEEDRKQNENS
ncbi:hypothetical protein CYCME_1824 [Cycloclasticus zancles 78-ME]|uniref:Uncharacterized protein n=2 Tax=Piscirickettsiaceae TaxID=135616 RepID=S5T926_9GAMM|nr:hypothetical protein CYCME_1824 [Cycloclasticus zancles 78-ME]